MVSFRVHSCCVVLLLAGCGPEGGDVPSGARNQPGTGMGIYTPEQHQAYDGHFVITATGVHQVGALGDASPWDHMGNDATNVRAVAGSAELDVNEIANTGTFHAALQLPEGEYVLTLDSIHEFSSCQDGGIAAYLFEHGDAGCGDGNWPKSLLYVAGWGYGTGTLNGDTLYTEYEVHFMVTQGMRDRATLRVHDAVGPSGAGAVNPAAQQLDFYIRSPAINEANHPGRATFDHFFAMQVAWR